jgi:hypothetical protein
MTRPPHHRLLSLLRHHCIKALIAMGAVLAVVAGVLGAVPSQARAAGSLPCDLYGTSGAPCVAAYSTVRALYSAYDDPLYRVTRASDNTALDIGVLAPGGYADAAAQDSFCAGTTCVITEIYDQSSEHNNLTIEGPGGADGQDYGANAAALPMTIDGHHVYGVDITAGSGYRNSRGAGVATNGQPEGMYMVASGTNVNDLCCFDFGNVETSGNDTGASHMDALNLSRICGGPCTGVGPWVQADLENGVFQGSGPNPANKGNASRFVTAMLKNDGQSTFELEGGNAQSGGLTVAYNGPLPPGYAPMHQEGAIVLGTGGDNSNWDAGSFFEGVITAGYPSDAADSAVQADIVAAGYSGSSGAGPGGTITGPGGQCVDVQGEDSGVGGAPVDLRSCQPDAADQRWEYTASDTLLTLGRCLDIVNNDTAPGSGLELWDCNGVPGEVWVTQPDGSLLNPNSGLCLTAPGGGRLQVGQCRAGAAAQRFSVNGGGTVTVPSGKCTGINGGDKMGDGAQIILWDCQTYAGNQHWYYSRSARTLESVGRCLDATGNSTADGTRIQLWDCDGSGGEAWVPQPNGTVVNPQSGKCLDDPNGNTGDGTQLQIWDCIPNDGAQQFRVRW